MIFYHPWRNKDNSDSKTKEVKLVKKVKTINLMQHCCIFEHLLKTTSYIISIYARIRHRFVSDTNQTATNIKCRYSLV